MNIHKSTSSKIYNVLHFDDMKSTNVYLYQKLLEGEDIINQVVVTDYQSEGKGLDKNKWESERGQNLLFSIALDLRFLEAENQFKLSQAVSVGILNILKKYLPESMLSIKWPNDIYYSDNKLAGMLINNSLEGKMMGISIIGIGLNVNQTKFGKALSNPTPVSMKTVTDVRFDLEPLLHKMVNEIIQSVYTLRTDEGQKDIEKSYIQHLYRYGKKATYEYQGRVITLTIIGLDKYGRLQLKDNMNNVIICDLKEIKFLFDQSVGF